jgi:hypothetical protein
MTDQPPVFVFGSNMDGRHGKGAALWARKHRGAIYGQSYGIQGNSFAIPTKDAALRPLSLENISGWVLAFIVYAEHHPEKTFELTPIGCGLAGYKPAQVAPFFRTAPPNVILPPAFLNVLEPAWARSPP